MIQEYFIIIKTNYAIKLKEERWGRSRNKKSSLEMFIITKNLDKTKKDLIFSLLNRKQMPK